MGKKIGRTKSRKQVGARGMTSAGRYNTLHGDSLCIEDIMPFEFLDSRGNPTVAVEVLLSGGARGLAIVPSGASRGKREALELRDGDKKRFHGKGVTKALKNIREKILPKLKGVRADNQHIIDGIMLSVDGTRNKSSLGANSILAVSLAVAKASANALGVELFEYLGGKYAKSIPVPLCNVINGGEHAGWNIDFQEYMLVPVGFGSFHDAIRCASEIFHTLKKIIVENGWSVAVGDEGGFAPPLDSNKTALELLMRAVEKSKYKVGDEVFFALDVASSSFWDEKKKKYVLRREGKTLDSDDMAEYIIRLCEEFPIISVEDPMSEDDWDGWKKITSVLCDRGVQVVGDDVFVTNPEIFQRGISEGVGTAILVKVNQIGTLWETLEVIDMAKRFGYSTIISHRSGDTEDTFIADLAVGVSAGQIKTGSLSRSERIAKYNRLIYIEETKGLPYAGKSAFPLLRK